MSCRFCRVALCCASLCSDMFGVVMLCRVVLCCIALCYIMSWVVVLHCVMFDCVRVCCVAKSLGCGFAFVPVAHKYLYMFLWSERRPGQTLIHKRFCEMASFDKVFKRQTEAPDRGWLGFLINPTTEWYWRCLLQPRLYQTGAVVALFFSVILTWSEVS